MGHQVNQRDRLRVRRREFEVEIGVDVRVHIQLALLDEVHHRRPGKRLADGARVKDRRVRVDGYSVLQVSVTVAVCKKELAVLHNRDRCAWNVIRLDLRCQEISDEGFQLAGIGEFPFLWFMGRGRYTGFGSNLHRHGRDQASDEYGESDNATSTHRFLLLETLSLSWLQRLRKTFG